MRLFCCCAAIVVMSLAGCERPVGNIEEEHPAVTVPPFDPASPANTVPMTHPPISSTPEAETSPESGPVTAGPFVLTPPGDWQRKTPRSSMVMYEFALPATEGDSADGRLTISQAGGSVEANIDRWRGQFQPKPETDEVKTIEANGTEVTVVDLAGNFMESRGPMFPAEERTDYRMLAAIIPESDQSYFIKAYGPKKTMEQYVDQFEAFVKSLERK